MKKQILIVIIAVIVLAALVAGGIYYWKYYKKGAEGEKGIAPVVPEVSGLGATVDIGEATANPVENMPSTNPYEKAVNPFEDAYKNPFK